MSTGVGAQAAPVRTKIKLLALITERERRNAAEAKSAGFSKQAQMHEDFASLCAMFAHELAQQNRGLLAA